LIEDRKNPSVKEHKEIIRDLKKIMPEVEVDESVLKRIEQDPGYINDLTRRRMSEMAVKESQIFDKLFEKSASGDMRAMKLYLQMRGLLTNSMEIINKGNEIQEQKEKREQIKSMSDDELNKQMQNIMEEVGWDDRK
jgi:hypothetical protein